MESGFQEESHEGPGEKGPPSWLAPAPPFTHTLCPPSTLPWIRAPEYSKNVFPPRMAPPLSTSVPAESSAWKTPLMALQSLPGSTPSLSPPTSAHGVGLTTPSSVFSRTLTPGWSPEPCPRLPHEHGRSDSSPWVPHTWHKARSRRRSRLGSRRGLAEERNSTSWSPRPSAVRPLPRATHLFA